MGESGSGKTSLVLAILKLIKSSGKKIKEVEVTISVANNNHNHNK